MSATKKPAVFRQCAMCPWKATVNPLDIPNGYSAKKHAALSCTIAEQGSMRGGPRMACHEFPVGKERECAGWLANQIGPGNNIALRLWAMTTQPEIILDGEQHEHFEDTLPKSRRGARQ